MARHFKVSDTLGERDWRAFLAVCHDRRTTVDSARVWLREHGCRVSRSAVHSVLRKERDQLKGCFAGIGASDASRRAYVNRAVEELHGAELLVVAQAAAMQLVTARQQSDEPTLRRRKASR